MHRVSSLEYIVYAIIVVFILWLYVMCISLSLILLMHTCRSGSLGGDTKEFMTQKMNGWSKFQIKQVSG